MTGPAEERDVLVVGGGPAGSATAIFLKQLGHDVLLVDAARFPRDKLCGEGLSPGTWHSLAALGVASRLRALGPWPLQGMRVVAADGTAFTGHYAAPAAGFALRRTVFDAMLLDQARGLGVEVREATRAVELLRRDGGVCGAVVERDGGTGEPASPIRARIVVAADGRRGIVARRLGLLREHATLRRFAVRGYWDGVEGLGERGEMHVARGAYCGVAPLSAVSANVTFVLDAPAMALAGGDLPSFYRRTLERWPELAERLQRAHLREPPRAIGPLALVAGRTAPAGLLRVGDAAGFFDPFTGEGIALALRSAELAARVASGVLRGEPTAALGAYDRERRRLTRHKFRFNRLVHLSVDWPWLGNVLAHRLRARPHLADQLVAVAGDLAPARGVFGPGFAWRLLF